MTFTELNEIKKSYKVLELAVDFINPSYNISRAKHLDNSRYILCTLTENGIPRSVKTNEVARIRLQKPDKTYVYNECDVLEDGRVLITLTEQILAVEGNAVCDIQLVDEQTEIIYSTKNFIINIDKTAVNNSVIASSNEFDALNKLIATNKKINEELKANEKVRQENESERIENENERKGNEADRQNAESERVNAENVRKANENVRISNENTRKENETIRQEQESDRQTNTATAISNAENATKKANDAADDLQHKLDTHHFVLTEDKDIAGGVPSLDANRKVPVAELYEATISSKGIIQLTDSVTSTSTTTAATPNSVKTAYDKAVSAGNDVKTHNSSSTAHTDIRNLISELHTKLNTLADSDDTTLDQLSEIVAYIKNNKSLIDSITTSKVNVADIIDNLTSTATNKPLSAKQGKVLNDLITALTATVGNKVDKVSGKGLSSNDYTTSEKNKLAGIANGAEVNQNAFSNITVGSVTITADSKTDTLTIAAGSNITLTADAANDKLIITAKDTTYSTGTASVLGLTKLYTATGTATDGTMTQAAIKSALDGKANASHGNHVPAVQTANNAVFLRNDNTWQTVTPANIGAAAANHSHNYAGSNASGGGATKMYLPRVAKSAAYQPGANTMIVEEFTAGANSSLPTNHWYHIFTGQGSDANYNTQLALGMTIQAVYYRYKNNNSWGNWKQLAFIDSTVSAATKATQDSAGQQINKTYIKGLSVNGKTITYTKGDGTTGTITTQDTNTTYSNMTAATASAAGKAGLVPAPAAGKQASFLRGDGTWATPTDTNTWRSITDSLTSTSTTTSLSAKAGKDLKDAINTINGNLAQNTSGKFELPNGLKMCWGSYTPPNANGYIRQGTITFPVTFGSIPHVFVTKVVSNSSLECQVTVSCSNQTKTNVSIKAMLPSQNLTNTEIEINWFAIGY